MKLKELCEKINPFKNVCIVESMGDHHPLIPPTPSPYLTDENSKSRPSWITEKMLDMEVYQFSFDHFPAYPETTLIVVLEGQENREHVDFRSTELDAVHDWMMNRETKRTSQMEGAQIFSYVPYVVVLDDLSTVTTLCQVYSVTREVFDVALRQDIDSLSKSAIREYIIIGTKEIPVHRTNGIPSAHDAWIRNVEE